MDLGKLDLYIYEMDYRDQFDAEIPCCFDELLEMFLKASPEEQLHILTIIEEDWRNQIIEMIDGGIIDVAEEVKAKRSSTSDRQYADKHYRINKVKKKAQKEKMERSIEGKKRKRMKPIMAKQRKTPTGRHRREYNV